MKIRLVSLAALLMAIISSPAVTAKEVPRTICDKSVAHVAKAVGKTKGTPMVQNWTISQGEKEGQLNFDVNLVNDLGFSKTSRVIVTVNVPAAGVCEIVSLNVVL